MANAAGSFRVEFSMRVTWYIGGTNSRAYGRIYLNGSAVGTTRVTNSNGNRTYAENIYGVSIGDYIQIYGRVYVEDPYNTYSIVISNLRLYCENFDGAASIR